MTAVRCLYCRKTIPPGQAHVDVSYHVLHQEGRNSFTVDYAATSHRWCTACAPTESDVHEALKKTEGVGEGKFQDGVDQSSWAVWSVGDDESEPS